MNLLHCKLQEVVSSRHLFRLAGAELLSSGRETTPLYLRDHSALPPPATAAVRSRYHLDPTPPRAPLLPHPWIIQSNCLGFEASARLYSQDVSVASAVFIRVVGCCSTQSTMCVSVCVCARTRDVKHPAWACSALMRLVNWVKMWKVNYVRISCYATNGWKIPPPLTSSSPHP